MTLKHVFAYTPIEPPRALKTYFCGKNISRNRTDLSVVSFSTMLTLSPSTDATFTGVSTVQEHFIYRRIWKTFATTCHITISLAEPLHSMNQFLKKWTDSPTIFSVLLFSCHFHFLLYKWVKIFKLSRLLPKIRFCRKFLVMQLFDKGPLPKSVGPPVLFTVCIFSQSKMQVY